MYSVGSGMVLAIGDPAGATVVTLLAATEDVATLLDVGTAVYGEGHSRPAQPHSRPSTAAGENAPRQDIPLDWVRGVERLHRLPAHAGVPQYRWGVFLNESTSSYMAAAAGLSVPPTLAGMRWPCSDVIQSAVWIT